MSLHSSAAASCGPPSQVTRCPTQVVGPKNVFPISAPVSKGKNSPEPVAQGPLLCFVGVGHPAVGRLRKPRPRSAVPPSVNQGLKLPRGRGAPVHDTAPRASPTTFCRHEPSLHISACLARRCHHRRGSKFAEFLRTELRIEWRQERIAITIRALLELVPGHGGGGEGEREDKGTKHRTWRRGSGGWREPTGGSNQGHKGGGAKEERTMDRGRDTKEVQGGCTLEATRALKQGGARGRRGEGEVDEEERSVEARGERKRDAPHTEKRTEP